MDYDEFSPEVCAELHNQLLARAIAQKPDAVVQRNLAERFLEAAPQFREVPGLAEIPSYRFLSLLNTSSALGGLLTPQMFQPEPRHFWIDSPFAAEVPDAVLLYGDNVIGERFDGGVFFNIETCRACWFIMPGKLPPPQEWVPLEAVLRHSLDMWDRGKFYWDARFATPAAHSWTSRDVADALDAWTDLLTEIGSRLPNLAGPRREPLERSSLDRFIIDPFVKEFLSRAPRPSFAHVAPGITTFTPELVTELYAAEATDSWRQRCLQRLELENFPSLIFPARNAVPEVVPVRSGSDSAIFDKEWGFGKFTIARRAGLYTDCDIYNADCVRLVSHGGTTDGVEPVAGTRRPEPDRSPLLAEVLRHWALLVRKGAWEVGPDGVSTPHEWFLAEDSRGQRMVLDGTI